MESSEKPTALITGAGIGIGAATAHTFADAGYRVATTSALRTTSSRSVEARISKRWL